MRPILPSEVVLFLQNPWFSPDTPEEDVRRYSTDLEYRRTILAKTMTGRRLLAAFGTEWYEGMWIDNANPLHSQNSRGWYPANHTHMANVIMSRMPRVVATMGLTAKRGFEGLLKTENSQRYFKTLAHLHCPHPNSMGITQDVLDSFAIKVMGCQVPE